MLKEILGNKKVLIVTLISLIVLGGIVLILLWPKDTEESDKLQLSIQTEEKEDDKDKQRTEDAQENKDKDGNDSVGLDVVGEDGEVQENSTSVPNLWDDETGNKEDGSGNKNPSDEPEENIAVDEKTWGNIF